MALVFPCHLDFPHTWTDVSTNGDKALETNAAGHLAAFNTFKIRKLEKLARDFVNISHGMPMYLDQSLQ